MTLHGFALNVDPEMRHFAMIIPCGIRDHGVTSLARLLGRPVALEDVREHLARNFAELFDLSLQEADLQRLKEICST